MSFTLPLSGQTYRQVEKEEAEKIQKFSNPSRPSEGLIRVNKEGWLLGQMYANFAEKFSEFEVRTTDVYLVTFRKAGTTWTQEILWTMFYNPNLDHPDQNVPINERSIFLDFDTVLMRDLPPEKERMFQPLLERFRRLCPGGDKRDGPQLQVAGTLSDPRVLKLHLPLSLLPDHILQKAKIVYVARDPRDVVRSLHHHKRLMSSFTGTVDDLCEVFLEDGVVHSPYWLHVKEAWQKRHLPNFHFMLFEDMKADITKEIQRLDKFLGTNLTEQQIENVKNHTAFSAMKKREDDYIKENEGNPGLMFDPNVMKKEGGFFRQGNVGDGKKVLSPESLQKMDEWIQKRFDFGLEFN